MRPKYCLVAILVSVVCITLRPIAFGADAPREYQFQETVNGQKIKVILETGEFDPTAQSKARF